MVLRSIQDNNNELCGDGLMLNLETMKVINQRKIKMWEASNYKNFNSFRAFIMGSKGNEEIFGDGIIYEGVDKFKNKPQQFRGPSGAHDDIIPAQDIFSGIVNYYPTNMLTEYLKDLRTYRPRVI